MKKATKMTLAGMVLGGTLAFLSCAEPPERTIAAARSAHGALSGELEGAIWAPEEFHAADAAMRQAETELRRQAGRWGLRRDYGLAFDLFRAAIADLERARQAAVASRETARKDATEAVEAAYLALDNARTAMLVAPVGREGRSAAARLDDGLERAALRLDEAREQLRNGDFKEALAGADLIREEVSSLVHALGR